MTARAAVVAVVGAGGIGHPAIVALANEPIALRVIDDDRVEWSNLHRLALADAGDVGVLKTEVALRIRGRNPADQAVVDRVSPETALRYLAGADLVIEASDNYATKFLVADACMLLGVRSVHGAAVGWIGTVLSVVPGVSACYRCVFEDLPSGDPIDCATAGVFGPVTSVVGALLARDAVRLLAGDTKYAGAVGSYDGFRNTFRSRVLARRADCALCGTRAIRNLDAARYSSPECAA